jgi:1-acyl-sn-glycerol-3-phosphate acyltransferase
LLFFRSLMLFVGMITLVLLFAVLVIVNVGTRNAPRRRRRLAAIGGRLCLRWFACSAGLDYSIEGSERLPVMGDVPTILFWRHESAWETFLSLTLSTDPTWVLKRELLWLPIVGWGIFLLDPIAIDRASGRTAVIRVLKVGRRQLLAGRVLNLFPEGTRLAPQARRRYGMSGALLASELGARVIPIAHDAGTYWPRRAFFKRPGCIRVLVGPPIDVSVGDAPEAINARATAWMEQALASLRPGER